MTKVNTVMMLNGQIEVTVKAKQYKVTTQAPKYDSYLMEQEVHGLK